MTSFLTSWTLSLETRLFLPVGEPRSTRLFSCAFTHFIQLSLTSFSRSGELLVLNLSISAMGAIYIATNFFIVVLLTFAGASLRAAIVHHYEHQPAQLPLPYPRPRQQRPQRRKRHSSPGAFDPAFPPNGRRYADAPTTSFLATHHVTGTHFISCRPHQPTSVKLPDWVRRSPT